MANRKNDKNFVSEYVSESKKNLLKWIAVVYLPSDQYHSIHADLTGRTELLYFVKPDYKSVRRQGPNPFPGIKQLPGEGR